MRNSDRVLVGVFLCALVAAAALPGVAQLNGLVESWGTFQAGTRVTDESMTLEPGMMRMAPRVSGQTYSGEMETEHTLTLSNGTHIDQKREVSRITATRRAGHAPSISCFGLRRPLARNRNRG